MSVTTPRAATPGPTDPTGPAHRAAPVVPRGRRHAPGSVLLRLLLVVGAAGVVAFWWPGAAPVAGGPGEALSGAGDLAGLLASFLVCALLLLVARVPWFERAVGMDRLVAWHRNLGASVVLLVATHVVLVVVGGAMLDAATPWAETLTLVRTRPELLSAVVGTALFLAVGATSARLLRRYLSYEAWYAVHLTVYAGVYLAFGHQLAAGTHFVASPVARAVWTGLYVATAAAIVTWRVAQPLWRLGHHLGRVQAVVPETPTTTSVWVSGPGVAALGGQGGQFFLVRFLTRGHLGTAHPYSLSAPPVGGLLRFTIGALGDHSSGARGLRPGTRVLLEGPFGRTTADRARSARVLLVAGGAGIGPIRALAEELYRRGKDVVVLHRARTADELALGHEMAPVPGQRYVALPGRRAELGYDPLSATALRRLVPDVAAREVFVCGPPGLVDTVRRSASALGVPRSAVHHEELSLS
ncbi:ferredoxin reductase family protein [Isoptericola sp. BMS4]|uniref:ferredoxin reductase family protein n=1 Tax=Isoptericola sp. BMS4 TaxID=2527875 RepID=UPI001423471A|nr:ferredoxin reductase family protein [Isoptericola sp. BMS4]